MVDSHDNKYREEYEVGKLSEAISHLVDKGFTLIHWRRYLFLEKMEYVVTEGIKDIILFLKQDDFTSKINIANTEIIIGEQSLSLEKGVFWLCKDITDSKKLRRRITCRVILTRLGEKEYKRITGNDIPRARGLIL